MPSENPKVCPYCSSEIGIKNRSYTCYNCGTEYKGGYLIGFPTGTCMSAQICQLERQIQQQADELNNWRSWAKEELSQDPKANDDIMRQSLSTAFKDMQAEIDGWFDKNEKSEKRIAELKSVVKRLEFQKLKRSIEMKDIKIKE